MVRNRYDLARLVHAGMNYIDVLQPPPQEIVNVIYLYETHPVATLIQNIRSSTIATAEEAKANFMHLLHRTDDDDDLPLDVTTFKFSLLDPLSFARMTVPVRSLQCAHVSCFDLQNFVELYKESDKRCCPVCNRSIRIKDLREDRFVLSILEQTSENEDEIEMNMNGEWKHCPKEEEEEEEEEGTESEEEGIPYLQQDNVFSSILVPDLSNLMNRQFFTYIPPNQIPPFMSELQHDLVIANYSSSPPNDGVIDLANSNSDSDSNVSPSSMYNNSDPNVHDEIEIIDISD